MCWKLAGIFFSIEFGILSGPRVLLLARFFRQRLYVSRSMYVCRGVSGFPRLSMMSPSTSCHGYCLTPHVHWGGWFGKKWQVGTVGLLLMDCCIWISFAISSGLVRMLLFLSIMQLSGGVSKFLKTFLFIFFGLLSYSCLYLEMAFLIHSFVYLVVIFLAFVFSVLANVASSFIHSFFNRSSFGGGGIFI